jgi:hypothetical protein
MVADALSRVESVTAFPSYDAIATSQATDDELHALLMSNTDMYNTQNFWVSGLCPSPTIVKTRKNVSETGSVSVLR